MAEYITCGNLPDYLKLIKLDTTNIEMCFTQYLPIEIPGQLPYFYNIPKSLMWCKPLIFNATNREKELGNKFKYIYLTVRHLHGIGNRGGWHTDGFNSDDINYIWSNDHPTQFLKPKETFVVKTDCDISMKGMAEIAELDTSKLITYSNETLIRLDDSMVHRVNPEWYSGLRTFVKISFSNERYNLKGNAHNPAFNYDWKMYPRSESRNHPYVLED